MGDDAPPVPGSDIGAAPAKLEYQPALDGLRALAVIAVLTFHQGQLRGGFLGVDVFFVLSGFLITSLLLIDYGRTGHAVSLRFWARRARRLLPALFVFFGLVALYAAIVPSPAELPDIRHGAFAALFYYQNYWIIHRYPTHYPLSHTWSLSIEEQFYLVWPVLLAGLLWCTRRTAHLAAIVAVLIAASATLMAVRYQQGGVPVSYLPTQTRAHELLVGAFLAIVLLRRRGPRTRLGGIALEILGIGALVVLVVAALTVSSDSPWLYRGGFLMVAVTTGVLLTAAVSPTSKRLRAVLSVKPLVFIGLISYGLYLFHVPLYRFVDAQHTITDRGQRVALRYAAVLVVATVSYYLIERPIRRGALSGKAMALALPVTAGATVAVLLLSTSSGVTQPSLRSVAQHAPPGSTRVLVVGDAIAASLDDARPTFAGDGIYGAVASLPGCDGIGGKIVVKPLTYFPGRCSLIDYFYAKSAAVLRPSAIVLMIGPLLVFDHVVKGHRLRLGTPAYESYIDAHLDQLFTALGSGGTRRLVLTTVPCMRSATKGKLPAFAMAQRNRTGVAWVNRVFGRYADAHPNVKLADLNSWLCAPPRRRARSYRDHDGVGMSATGAAATWRWLAPLVRS